MLNAEFVQVDCIDVSSCDERASNLDLKLGQCLSIGCLEIGADIAEAMCVKRFQAATLAGNGFADLECADGWLGL